MISRRLFGVIVLNIVYQKIDPYVCMVKKGVVQKSQKKVIANDPDGS